MTPQERREIVELTSAVCDGCATDDQIVQLDALLRENAAARDLYLQMMDLHFDLDRQAARGAFAESEVAGLARVQPDTKKTSEFAGGLNSGESSYGRPRVRRFVTMAAMLIVGLAVGLWYSNRGIASVVQFDGTVDIAAADGTMRTAVTGDRLQPGETVHVRGEQSSAVVEYHDGTRLVLVGRTEVQCRGEDRKLVDLTHGTLVAAVTPQQPDRPMQLTTPAAGIEVLGTTFMVTASAKSSNLRVAEGTVRLTRTADSTSIDVPEGKEVDTGTEDDLSLRDMTPPPPTWTIEFQDGVPDGWVGTFMQNNLPEGHAGAINTVLDPENTGQHDHDDEWARYNVDRVIMSPRDGANGLFVIGGNTYLHLIYHTRRSSGSPVMVTLVTLSADDSTALRRYQVELKNTSGELEDIDDWYQASIPLSQFREVTDRQRSPGADELPLWIEFKCGPGHIFQLARIAASQSGPGRCLVRSEDELERRAQAKYGPRILIRHYLMNEELELTEEQVAEFKALAEETWPQYVATSRDDVDPHDAERHDELKQARVKVKRQFLLRVEEILTAEQLATLDRQEEERSNSPEGLAKAEARRQQVYGPGMLARPFLRNRALRLTEEQRERLQTLAEEMHPAYMATDPKSAGPDDKEAREQLKQQRARVLDEFHAKVREILTPEQMAIIEKQQQDE